MLKKVLDIRSVQEEEKVKLVNTPSTSISKPNKLVSSVKFTAFYKRFWYKELLDAEEQCCSHNTSNCIGPLSGGGERSLHDKDLTAFVVCF